MTLSAPPSARNSMRSTSFRSMVTFATSRMNSVRPPLATMLMFSAGIRPEEQQQVGAVLALDRVVAVARVPLEHVVAGAEERDVVAVVAEHEVVAVAAEERVRALAPEQGVVACSAVERQLDDAGRHCGRGDAVVAAKSVDDERVVRALGVRDVHARRQPEHRDRGAGAEDVDDVVAVGAVDDHDVGRAVARRCRRSGSRQVDVYLGEVGAGEVVTVIVSAPPSALRSIVSTSSRSITMLPRLRVNSARAAVGRDREDLVAGAAVEQHRVGAVLALDDVAARRPDPTGTRRCRRRGRPRRCPCWPSMKSSPSPPSSVSVPLLPRMVSLPAPPSTVILISAARLPVAREGVVAAVHVDDEVLGRADVDARTAPGRAGRSARACRSP